jgi:hypothetical protein
VTVLDVGQARASWFKLRRGVQFLLTAAPRWTKGAARSGAPSSCLICNPSACGGWMRWFSRTPTPTTATAQSGAARGAGRAGD